MLAGQVHKPPDNSKKGVKGQTKPLGAGDRDRTRDNRSTKPGLYQLSYTSILSAFISPTVAAVALVRMIEKRKGGGVVSYQ